MSTAASIFKDHGLYHSQNVMMLADFLSKEEDKTPSDSLRMIFEGEQPILDDYINTMIALRKLADEKLSVASKSLQQLAHQVRTDASQALLETTRLC